VANLARRIAADANGPAAIPRRNGEPVFDEPWESRVFGMAVGLCERGFYVWDEFRERLIAEDFFGRRTAGGLDLLRAFSPGASATHGRKTNL
jgi:hypothetical protein